MDAQDLQLLKNKYDIVGNDAALNRALETAAAVAPTDLTVLIEGESGVGKETIPQIIHQMSRRRTGKYLPVNCGAIPEGTINAELFGHEKGSFTGAIGERKGYFEEANGGTIFLDEIGELPKDTQAMLLRVLQNGEYMKVGSSKVEKTDVRVIAATNVNLQYAVAQGKFREDLYYRLNAITVKMPALRERKDDIYLLFRKFTSDFSEKYSRTKIALNHEAIAKLRDYRWPGNIRQLKNITESISALESRPLTPGSEKVELDAATLSKYLPDEQDSLLPAPAGTPRSQGVQDADMQMLVKAILDIKQDVERLKQAVYNAQPPVAADNAIQPPVSPDTQAADRRPDNLFEEAEWQEAAAAEHFTLRKATDEMIEQALRKHGGKVKPAAAELGISERTIYRKIADWKEKGK